MDNALGASDKLKDSASMKWGLENAMIAFWDEREKGKEVAVEEKAKAQNKTTGKMDTSKVSKSKKLQDLAKEKMGLDDNLSKMLIENEKELKVFKVQFNPNRLSFTAYGSERSEIPTNVKPDGEDKKNGEQPKARDTQPPRIELTIPLVFDAFNASDAFMLAYSQITLYSLKNILQSKFNKKVLSVQPVVEAFIAALRNKNTRKVCFIWGDMMYDGILNSVTAKYTMFSIVGRPIRANVDLTILTTSGEHLKQWKKKYQNYFETRASSEHTQIGQKYNNLLNL